MEFMPFVVIAIVVVTFAVGTWRTLERIRAIAAKFQSPEFRAQIAAAQKQALAETPEGLKRARFEVKIDDHTFEVDADGLEKLASPDLPRALFGSAAPVVAPAIPARDLDASRPPPIDAGSRGLARLAAMALVAAAVVVAWWLAQG